MPHFIYDQTANKTIAVVKADIDPDMLMPSSEDAVSTRQQWDAILAGHQLKVCPLPPGAYREALKLFHQGQELVVVEFADDAAKATREASRKRMGRRISEGTRADVLNRHAKGQSITYIVGKLDISDYSVRGIIRKASGSENGTSTPA